MNFAFASPFLAADDRCEREPLRGRLTIAAGVSF